MTNTDIEWQNFLSGIIAQSSLRHVPEMGPSKPVKSPEYTVNESKDKSPICDDLYISTKTKVLYLNQEIDIQRIFWEIPIVEYWKQEEGVIKKQMKIVFPPHLGILVVGFYPPQRIFLVASMIQEN